MMMHWRKLQPTANRRELDSALAAGWVTLFMGGRCTQTSVRSSRLHQGCTVIIQPGDLAPRSQNSAVCPCSTRLAPSCLPAGPALQHSGRTSVQSCAFPLQLLNESPCCTMRHRYFACYKMHPTAPFTTAMLPYWSSGSARSLLSRLDRGLGLPIRPPGFCQAC